MAKIWHRFGAERSEEKIKPWKDAKMIWTNVSGNV